MDTKASFMSIFSAMITLLMLSYTANAKAYNSSGKPQQPLVPCFFILGDSLVDNGNNNHLFTLVKSNFWPYGIDFPQGPTGRFNNGRTIVDLFAEHLGFSHYMPPFANSSLEDFITGVNFASGAAGIRDESGNFLGANIPMNKQIGNFAKVVEQLRGYFKNDTKVLQNHLNKCIYYSSMGNNDYLNNYFMTDFYPTALIYNPKDYATALVQQYSSQLKALYNLGARKVIVPGIGKMGCIPIKRNNFNMTTEKPCNETENEIIKIFNSALRGMLHNLNRNHQLPRAKFVYLDNFKAFNELIYHKEDHGFEEVDKGCFNEGNEKKFTSGKYTSFPLLKPCKDRNKYLFWDYFHPTEVVHVIIAKEACDSNIYTHPINIKQLAML